MKSFIDSTGGLWQKGALVGKPVTMITSSGTQGGGIEVRPQGTGCGIRGLGMPWVGGWGVGREGLRAAASRWG